MQINHTALQAFEQSKTADLTESWVSKTFPLYFNKPNKAKGTYGEEFFAELMSNEDYTRIGNTEDHDGILNGKKVEIKFSMASNKQGIGVYDSFTFNHIGIDKKWDLLVLIGVNPPQHLCHYRRGSTHDEDIRMYVISKEDLVNQLDDLLENKLISKQAGGAAGTSDDYMVTDYRKILQWKGITPLDEIIS